MKGLTAVSLSVSLAILAPARALAQDASSQAAAQALFEQARQLMADGKFAEACPKLAESQRLDPGAGTLLNLGHCYEKNGQTASAWVTFKDAAAAADLKHRADWSQRARERSQALEPGLSRITIDVSAEARPEGLQVWRDGVEVGRAVWGSAIPVDPGDHALQAIAPGKKRWSTAVKVRPGGDTAHVVVPALEDEAAATPLTPPPSASGVPTAAVPPASTTLAPASPSPEGGGSSQRTIGLVLGGVGVAGLAAGSIFGGLAFSKNSDAKTLCPTSPGCSSQAGVDANNDAKSDATISTVAVIAGGAVLVTGAVLFLVAPKKRSSVGFHVVPAVGAGFVGAGMGGSW